MMITHYHCHKVHRLVCIPEPRPTTNPARPRYTQPHLPLSYHATKHCGRDSFKLAAKKSDDGSGQPSAPKRRGRPPGSKRSQKADKKSPAVQDAADEPTPRQPSPAAASSSTSIPSAEQPDQKSEISAQNAVTPSNSHVNPPSTSTPDNQSPDRPLDTPEQAPSTSTTSELPVQQDAPLPARSREGYLSFEMDGVELLISETPDGLLSLKDCYVFDDGSSVYAEPTMEGEIPSSHQRYQCIPWTEEYLGDTWANKDPWTKIMKMIFIPILSLEPYEIKLDDVYIFSAETKRFWKAEVERVGPFIIDPVLRIREDKVTIEDTSYSPTFMEVQVAAEAGREPEPAISADLLQQLEQEIAEMRGSSSDRAADPAVS